MDLPGDVIDADRFVGMTADIIHTLIDFAGDALGNMECNREKLKFPTCPEKTVHVREGETVPERDLPEITISPGDIKGEDSSSREEAVWN